MLELIHNRFIPTEMSVQKLDESQLESHKDSDVEKICGDYYLIKKRPKLEMIFREGDNDYPVDMTDYAKKYYNKDILSEKEVCDFVLKVISGKIKISVSQNLICVIDNNA